jgi:hypothetical protein
VCLNDSASASEANVGMLSRVPYIFRLKAVCCDMFYVSIVPVKHEPRPLG